MPSYVTTYNPSTLSHLIAAIDESLRARNYLLCATIASTSARPQIRQSLRSLLLPNQRRLHAKHESPGRRRSLLKSLADTPGFTCRLLIGRSRDERDRDECLRILVGQLLDDGIREIILERIDDGTELRDALVVNKLAQERSYELLWRHEVPDREPLLWISDLVAHAYGNGGDFRMLTAPMVSRAVLLD